VLNFLFVGALLTIEFKGPHTGLALASSVAAYINAGLLFRRLRSMQAYTPEPGWWRVILAVLLATGAMTAGLWWQYGAANEWAAAAAFSRAGRLCLLIVFGAFVYGVVLFLGGLRKHHLQKGAN